MDDREPHRTGGGATTQSTFTRARNPAHNALALLVVSHVITHLGTGYELRGAIRAYGLRSGGGAEPAMAGLADRGQRDRFRRWPATRPRGRR